MDKLPWCVTLSTYSDLVQLLKSKGSERIGHLMLMDITRVVGPVLDKTQIGTWSEFGMKAGLIPHGFWSWLFSLRGIHSFSHFASESFPADFFVRIADCASSQEKRLTVSGTLSQRGVPAFRNLRSERHSCRTCG